MTKAGKTSKKLKSVIYGLATLKTYKAKLETNKELGFVKIFESKSL